MENDKTHLKYISMLIKCTFRLPKNKDLYIIIYDITGFCCALFDEGVGRVVEDYFNPCSDCPFVYQSDDVSKCKNFHLIFLFYNFLCRKSKLTYTLIGNTCLDSKCVGKKKDTSTPGRYKKYTAIADKNNSFETSKVLISQRSSFAMVNHPVMLYETPATKSFTVMEGKDIQQKGYVSCYRSIIFTINNRIKSEISI